MFHMKLIKKRFLNKFGKRDSDGGGSYLLTVGYVPDVDKSQVHKIWIQIFFICKNFRELCNNQWKNYLFHLIVLFNDMRDFEKGNGLN